MDSRQALQQLQQFQSSRQPAQNYYQQAQQELGVGASQQRAQELRGLIRGTEQALRGVESSVSGRTQGSLVTEAQRGRLANLERQPIAEQFREQQGALSEEETIRQQLLGEAGQRAGFAYQSDADRMAALQQQYQNVLGQETAAEERRRFEEQMRFSREQEQRLAAEAAATRAAAQRSSIDIQSIIDSIRGASDNQAAKPAPPLNISKTYRSPGGDILGYETNQGSVQTDAGNRQTDLELQAIRRQQAARSAYESAAWLPANLRNIYAGVRSLF
jgi:hypothetical protein